MTVRLILTVVLVALAIWMWTHSGDIAEALHRRKETRS